MFAQLNTTHLVAITPEYIVVAPYYILYCIISITRCLHIHVHTWLDLGVV